MIHDELLDKIEAIDYWQEHFANKTFLKTLLAVVELHKPVEEDGKLWCSEEVCYNHIEFLERDDCDCSYPCPTIQAIEKELK